MTRKGVPTGTAITLNSRKPHWQGQGDSNPRPSVLETDALPTELYPFTVRRPEYCQSDPDARGHAPSPQDFARLLLFPSPRAKLA